MAEPTKALGCGLVRFTVGYRKAPLLFFFPTSFEILVNRGKACREVGLFDHCVDDRASRVENRST
jgi:hypothetical protein